MKPVSDRRTIIGLHYVRAIATIMVVLFHAQGIAALKKYFGQIAFGGFFAPSAGEIDLFFMMSGVIMIISTHNKNTLKPRMSAREFFARRFIRIIPLLWISVILFCASIFALHPSKDFDFDPFMRAFLVWPVGQTAPFTAWTIRYEVLFYIIFGVCFLRFPALKWLAVFWFVSPLLLASIGLPPVCEDGSLLHFAFSPFNFEFGIGVALGYIYLKRQNVVEFRFQLIFIFFVFILIKILMWTVLSKYGNHYMFYHAAVLAPFCLVMVSCALWSDQKAIFKPLMFIGDASYSIFLFHPLVISPMLLVLTAIAPRLSPEVVVILTSLAGVAFGCVVHLVIEKPLVSLANGKVLARFKPALQPSA